MFLIISNLPRTRPFVSKAQLLILVKLTVGQEFMKKNFFKGRNAILRETVIKSETN